MIVEQFKLSETSKKINPGDLVCIDSNSKVNKVSNETDTYKVIGVCTEVKDDNVLVEINGLATVNTSDELLEPGDLVVSEVDGTVKCLTGLDDYIDVIGIVISKPEKGKVIIKLK